MKRRELCKFAAVAAGAAWDLAMPRLVKAGGGSVHGRLPVPAGLELDTDAVHGASASCHHGPPVTHPTPVQLRAYHTEENLYLDARWEDATEDRLPPPGSALPTAGRLRSTTRTAWRSSGAVAPAASAVRRLATRAISPFAAGRS